MSTAQAVYQPSHIKRHRSTKAEVEQRRDALLKIVSAMHPMTVRQVFYQASVRDLVEKSEAGYAKVQTDLVHMRRSGAMPYDWLADNTRWQRKPRTFYSVKHALDDTARLYRKALWADADAYVEVWLEKDALAGVVLPITSLFDVPLMVARGYASLSFLHSAAEYINTLDVPTYIYHFGDFDPSGVNAGEKIEQTLKEMAPAAEIHFERVAVTPRQIHDWKLPTRPTKTTDSRAKSFGNISVELDAIEPRMLRTLVQTVIERHLPPEQFDVLKAAEEDERKLIAGLVGMLGGRMNSDHISHGTPEMLLHEIASTTAAAAFHADMAAQYAAAGNVAGALYALRCLVACTKAAAASGRDLHSMKQAEEIQ